MIPAKRPLSSVAARRQTIWPFGSDDSINVPSSSLGIVNYILGLSLLNFGEHQAR